MLNRKRIVRLAGLAIANLLISLWMGQQAYKWMPPQASAESILVDSLFSFMTAVGCFIFLGVVGTLLYSMIFQRAAKYDASDGPPIEGNIKLEIIWTALPILLVIWIGTVSFQTYDEMSILGPMMAKEMTAEMVKEVAKIQAQESIDVVEAGPVGTQKKGTIPTSSPNAPTGETQPIEVRARQWAWEFYYPEPGVSSTELHLPVKQRARFKLISEDVLHGLYVPAFRVKQDIIPGKEIDFSFTPILEGRYRLRDSEYSGTYFAANQTYVVVEPPEDYQDWLAAAADMTPKPAKNLAYEEFQKVSKNLTGFRWDTVEPAPAPIVNYPATASEPTAPIRTSQP